MTKPKRSLETRGRSTNYVTTGGAGYIAPINIEGLKSDIKNKVYNYITGGLPIDTVRNRIYRNLFQGYDPGIYNIINNINRVRKAVADNKEEYPDATSKYRQAYMDDLFAEYLQIPTNKRRSFYGRNHLEDSPYKPNIGKNNTKYKRIINGYFYGHSGLHPKDEERLVNAVMQGEYTNDIDRYSANKGLENTTTNHGPVELNRATISNVLSNYGIGTHTISRGHDNKGEYVSYYDLWDMAPAKNSGGNIDESMGIGKPVNIYDRLYLDDYYGVKDKDSGGYYIPEITITGKRKKHENGGSIKVNKTRINMTKPRRRLEVRGNYDAPVDATYVVKPVIKPDILPNLVFSPSINPNFARVGVGYNMHGQIIDYDNDGQPITIEEGIERIKKAWKNPRIKATKDAIRDMMLDAYSAENRRKHNYKDGGSIHISPSKRGTFTAAATKHGMGVQEFANRILRNKEDYSPSLVKKANFARNASKWNH